ncbi:MAG: hypothetical protein ACYTG3_13745 [Planctomycetota bacterium]
MSSRRRRRRSGPDREWALLFPWELLFLPMVLLPLGVAVALVAAVALLVLWLIVRAHSSKRR